MTIIMSYEEKSTERNEKGSPRISEGSPEGSLYGVNINGLSAGDPQKQQKNKQEKTTDHHSSRIAVIALELYHLHSGLLTVNPYERLIDQYLKDNDQYSEEARQLFKLLIHGLTLLNKLYRMEKNGCYQSSREDLMVALELMGRTINPLYGISDSLFEYYHGLHDRYGSGQFTRKMAEGYLGIRKTHACRVLEQLYKWGLIQRYGYRNRGYWYRISCYEK